MLCRRFLRKLILLRKKRLNFAKIHIKNVKFAFIEEYDLIPENIVYINIL